MTIEETASSKNDSENEETEDKNDQFKFFTNEFLTVMYANIDQSITGKMSELLGNIEKQRPDIIMLTEIEPKAKQDPTKKFKESEIEIPSYAMFLNQNRKRGVAI